MLQALQKAVTTLTCAIVVSLTACGGGGEGGGTTVSSSTISGVAASGAALIGTVRAKDSAGRVFGSVQIAADGRYTLNTVGGVAPYFIEATGTAGTFYSVASSSPLADLNVNPLTTMVVAQAAGVAPATLFNGCSTTSCAIPSASKVATAESNTKALLSDLLTVFGVSSSTNLLASAFVAGPVTGQSALDKMLDTVSFVPVSGTQSGFEIKPNAITGLNVNTVLATIPAAPDGGVVSVTTSPLVIDSALGSAAITQATNILKKLAGIQKPFDAISTLFAASKPSASNPNLLALFSPDFLYMGQTLDEYLYRLTGMDGASAGMVLRVVSASKPPTLPSPQILNDATHQWFTFSSTDAVNGTQTLGPWLAVFDQATSKWLIAGNQLPASIELGTPTVADANFGASPCCVGFKATVPFTTQGFDLVFNKTQVTNAAWEFTAAVRFCDAPSVPDGQANCSAAWKNNYQAPPFINPALAYAGAGSYVATRDDAASPTTGNLGFALSYHLYEFQSDPATGQSSYVLVGPKPISVTATLVVTVTNPVTGATKIVRSKPITVTY